MTRAFQTPQSGVRFISLQTLARRGRWRTEAMRAHDSPVLIWFTRGQGRITMAGQTRGYGGHTLAVIPANVMYGFEATPATLGAMLILERADATALPDTPRIARILDHAVQADLTDLLERLAREHSSPSPDSTTAVRALSDLVLVWVNRQLAGTPTPDKAPTASERLAAAFTALLEEKFSTGTRVADYARVLGITPTHLSRACRDASGRSASDLLQDRVFFEARRLLLDTDLPIREIAARLGFRSSAYFTRAFGKATGQTPTAFRNQAARQKGDSE